MSDGDKDAVYGQFDRLFGGNVAYSGTCYPHVVSEHFLQHVIPLYRHLAFFFPFEQLLLQDLFGAQLIPSMY